MDGGSIKGESGREIITSTHPDWRSDLFAKFCHHPRIDRKTFSYAVGTTFVVFS
jgi:hypothetical protein